MLKASAEQRALQALLQSDRDASPRVLERPVPVDALPTPCVVIDLDALERNIDRMARATRDAGLALRPHGKMHKCPEIARRQIAAGAVGICVAKAAEAEVYVAAGIESVLVTSPVVRTATLERLVALVDRADICLVVDSETGIDALSQVAAAHGVDFPVCLDLDPDMGRTGVLRDAGGVALAERIAADGRLQLRGIQQYCGNLMHVADHTERAERVRAQARKGLEFVSELERRGLTVGVRTGGGTGSFDLEAEAGLLTELQAGSYIVMDREYGEIGFREGVLLDAFEPALHVHASVISTHGTHVTVDAGIKAMATDTVRPAVAAPAGLGYRFAGDEHGVVVPARSPEGEIAGRGMPGDNAPMPLPALGSSVCLLAPHCDPTINLHDHLLMRRGGEVVEVWPVAARGAGW